MRYLKQTILPQVGLSGQTKIGKSKVIIVGCGGLGSSIALYLAGAGVGQIDLVDGDQVEESNLHRQVIFNQSDIGQNKAINLSGKLVCRNPNVKSNGFAEFLDREIGLRLLNSYDIIVDGSDNFETKFLLNDICCLYKKPIVYGAVSQFEGQVAVFDCTRGPCYRCLFPRPPSNKIQNCSEAGILGPVVGAIAQYQALEVLKIILGMQGLSGTILFVDFERYHHQVLNRQSVKTCLCQQKALNESDIPPAKLPFSCSSKPYVFKHQIIDVREDSEWHSFHIAESLHWPLSRLEKNELPNLAPEKMYFLICASGVRAYRAFELLQSKKIQNVKPIGESIFDLKTL